MKEEKEQSKDSRSHSANFSGAWVVPSVTTMGQQGPGFGVGHECDLP